MRAYTGDVHSDPDRKLPPKTSVDLDAEIWREEREPLRAEGRRDFEITSLTLLTLAVVALVAYAS
jgi:hypothetical protein